MTENSTKADPSSAGFRKLYIIGVVGWLLGMAALFGASWILSEPETVSIAMLWTMSHSWIALLFGLVLMGISGVLSKTFPVRPMLAYMLPVALLAAIAAICLAIYPDASLRGDFLIYLPMVLVFYCLGCLWMAFGGADRQVFPQAVTPAVIGGLMLIGFVAIPAFASDDFRYRDAFQLTMKETKIQDGALVFNGVLEIQKPGNYEFTAPRYYLGEDIGDGDYADTELGEIQWGDAGAPKEGALGTFPLRIVWTRSVTQDGANMMSPLEEGVLLEVRRPDQGGKFIYSVTAGTVTY